MKVIVDIPNELAEKEHWYTDEEMWAVIKAAQNGTPLDDIKAGINEAYQQSVTSNLYYAEGLEKAFEIIEKHTQ